MWEKVASNKGKRAVETVGRQGERRSEGLRVADLLFDLSLTSERPHTDMWLPSGPAYHAIMPSDLFLNVTWIMLLWLI